MSEKKDTKAPQDNPEQNENGGQKQEKQERTNCNQRQSEQKQDERSGQAGEKPQGEANQNGETSEENEGGHVKLEDLSVDELRKFVMFQKQINDALVKENEQLIKEKQELGRVIANSDKYLDQLVALKSDFSSYKERIRCDADRSRDEGKVMAMEKILPLLDTLEKARVDISDGKAFELIYRQFTKCLFEMGIEEIEALNLPFDPKVANAVTEREAAPENKGKVVEVYQKGYKYKDRILRYAQVIVGK